MQFDQTKLFGSLEYFQLIENSKCTTAIQERKKDKYNETTN